MYIIEVQLSCNFILFNYKLVLYLEMKDQNKVVIGSRLAFYSVFKLIKGPTKGCMCLAFSERNW